VGVSILFISWLCGPKLSHPKKNQPFECGIPAYSDSRRRFSVRFYLVAILFLMFDVETSFFYPWAIIFKETLSQGMGVLWEMGFFVGVLLIGYIYVLRRGALEWD
jgi:NADH-quinone oxidoreductase subunit A